MTARSGSRKKSGSTHNSIDAGEKDRLIVELKNRVAVLENELLSKQKDATSQEVMERRRVEEALHNNEKFLNNVFNCIQDGVSVLSKDLSVIRYNPTIEKWHGRDLTGKKCYRLFHGREEPCETCPSLRAIREKTMQREVVRDLIGWKELYAYPLINDDGEVTGTIEQVRDITEQKRAGEALRESEEKFRQMAENIGEVLFIFTPDWKQTIYVSPAYERVWGRSLNDVYGNSMAWLEGVHPDDCGLPLALINKHIMGNISETDTVEFRVMRPDGAVRWILARTYPVLDKQGGVCRITGIAEDITERKRAEDELMTAKAEAELYLDLMGHDMNNIHQIALGYLELALSVPPEARQDELLYKPMEVLQRSAQLIQNVKKLQRLHDEIFQTEPVDVAKVLSDIQREFGAVPNKTVKLNLNGYDHYQVMANDLLHDVVANLVSNAIKHTGDRADIDIGLDVVDDNGRRYCRVSVEDNGPGIPDDFKAMIFNRMLKGTNKAKGIGLGLYLVKSLVESYNGRVYVEDRVPGDYTRGARFVVMLPAIDQ